MDAFRASLDLTHSVGVAEVHSRMHRRYSDRICSPEETFQRISPLFLRYGVTRLARQTGLDSIGIPVWTAMRPNSLSLAVNQGKGIGDADARVSAAMEALERAIAGEPEVVSTLASATELRASGLIAEPLDGLIGAGQLPLDQDSRVDWVEGYDLLNEQSVWVPRDAVMLDRTVETRFWQSSDGLASGNTAIEATYHGLLERVERDADLLWSMAKPAERARCCVDTDTFRDPVIDALVEKIRGAGLRLQMFDITSDIGIPCYQALIGPADIERRAGMLYAEATNGGGCHPDPVRAAIRAITEAAQSRLTLISGARDDIPADTYTRPMPKNLIEDFCLAPMQVARQPVLSVDQPLPVQLRQVLDALRGRVIRSVIAVPLNPPDAPFSVVKVLAPELENPPGARRTRLGARAFARILVAG